MSLVGQIVEATVTRVEEYGVYLRHEDNQLLVLIVDVTYRPPVVMAERFHIGQTVRAKVLEFKEAETVYKASIREAEEANPYAVVHETMLSTIISATVRTIYDDEATVITEDDLWGKIRNPARQLQRGVRVRARIIDVDLEADSIVLELA